MASNLSFPILAMPEAWTRCPSGATRRPFPIDPTLTPARHLGVPHFTGIAGPLGDIPTADAPADGQTEFSFPHSRKAVGVSPISGPRRATVAFGQNDTDPSDKSAFDPDRPPVTAGSLYDIPRAGAPADDGTRSSFPKFGNAVDMGMISEPRGSAAAFGRNDPDRPRNDPDGPVYPTVILVTLILSEVTRRLL